MKGNKYIFALISLALCVALCACGSKAPEVPTTQAATTEAPAREEPIPETVTPENDVAWKPTEAPLPPPEEFELRLSPSKMITELVTRVYTDEELQEICDFVKDYWSKNPNFPTIAEVNQRYPAECVRVFAPQFINSYRFTYLGEHSVLVLGVGEQFDEIVVFDPQIMEMEHSLEEYLAIPAGTPVEAIQEMSPGGDYSRLKTSGITLYGNDLFSSHPTTDGYMVRIYYTYVPVEGEGWSRACVDRVYYELI